jgi:hypothetical protein
MIKLLFLDCIPVRQHKYASVKKIRLVSQICAVLELSKLRYTLKLTVSKSKRQHQKVKLRDLRTIQN